MVLINVQVNISISTTVVSTMNYNNSTIDVVGRTIKKPINIEDYYTLKQVATTYGASKKQINKLLKAKNIDTIKDNERTLILKKTIYSVFGKQLSLF